MVEEKLSKDFASGGDINVDTGGKRFILEVAIDDGKAVKDCKFID
jgi:hypothetical protein